ncbi:hypothetical protein [Parasutterella excrementihominis]|uniref:hypothetical protein n=2 Tax=Parasutterella excrementihominis TaxID=487175 RepID=UPI003AB13A5E
MQTTVEAVKVLLKDPSTGTYLIPYLAEAAKVDKNGNEITGTYATKAELANYLSLAGGTVTGALSVGGGITASLNGNASSATKATQDSAGQQINSTYIKNVSVNGRTITFTRGDGTTFTITTQDTVTTNSSNWSVSNGTNGWARDNSTGFTIQWGTADTKATWIGFPRSFSSVLSVVSGQWYNSHSGDTDNILSWNNSGYTRSAIGAFKWTWVAVGFS